MLAQTSVAVVRIYTYAMLRQVELSVGRPQTQHGNVHQVDHVPNGPINSAAITTMFPLLLCGGKPLVAVTRERRYGPSRLRVNEDDDDDIRYAMRSDITTLEKLPSTGDRNQTDLVITPTRTELRR